MEGSSKQHLDIPNENEEDDIKYLSGNPYFGVVLSKSHVSPLYQLYVPRGMSEQLPRVTMQVVLSCGGKSWSVCCNGGSERPRLYPNWGVFVEENHLKLGDGCVFELMEKNPTSVRFKVHILRDELPPEFQAKVLSQGATKNTPINID